MGPLELIILLVAAGAVLLVGELLLPTHGLLGVVGALCLGGAIGVCFYLNRWLGLGVFFAAIVVSPVAFYGAMNLWKRSPVGRRIILPPVETSAAPALVRAGQLGITVSELRPTGECEFGQQRLEAISDLGMIAPGEKVRVVAVSNGRPTVRRVESAAMANET